MDNFRSCPDASQPEEGQPKSYPACNTSGVTDCAPHTADGAAASPVRFACYAEKFSRPKKQPDLERIPFRQYTSRNKIIRMLPGMPPFFERFPRAAKYNPDWVLASVSSAANPLWLSEWLATAMDLQPGMRVLDLGCGRAVSSIFLRREFGVQVWATDLWFSASENLQRIRDAGVEDGVFPIHADARSMPFAAEFFDAIVCIDAFSYFGTDDLYLNYLARFVKTGGRVGIDVWELLQTGKLFALRVELDSPDIVIDRLGPSRFARHPS